MPISPPAAAEPAAPAERGLTLVEVLVVLAIIGIVSGVTLAAIGRGGGGREAHMEADQLAARLRLAADDVRLADRPLGFWWDERGYRFVTHDSRGRWVADAVPELGEHRLPAAALPFRVTAGERPLRILPDGDGQPLSVDIGPATGGWRVGFDGLDAQAAARAP